MEIDAGNVLIACGATGYAALKLGQPGMWGALAGNAVYYFWLRDIIFG